MSPVKISVIDLGYNSLKLVNYEVNRDKSFAAYGQKSILARLGEGLDETGFLGDQPMKRTIKALRLLRDLVNLERVNHVLPIATSAVRDAGNREWFLKHAVVETGFAFKVLSEREEAVYSFTGARSALDVKTGVFFDLGGGSLEIVTFERSTVRRILSVPLGGLRLTDLYARNDGRFSRINYQRMRQRITELLPEKDELPQRADNNPVLVGVGGTVRALARYCQLRDGYPINKVHNYEMKRSSVREIHQQLRKMPMKRIRAIPSIGDRARSIVAGSLVVELIMEKLDLKRLTLSTHGLRDGVLVAFLNDPLSYRNSRLGNVLRNIALTKTKVSPSLEGLIDSLLKGKAITKNEQRILTCAAMEIPTLPVTNPESLFYLILEKDSVLGHPDQITMALSLARSQGMKRTEWLQAIYQKLINRESTETVERLSPLIRLMTIIDRTGSKITLRFQGGKRVQLKFVGRGGRNHFPKELLRNTIGEIQETLDLRISTPGVAA